MNMPERNYLHSRPLDVHRWSEHPEVNIFVDTIYNNDFRQGNENQRIKKKHLKLVLLDLYLAWFDDPDLNIGVHMSQSAYSNGKVFNKGVSRYNELNIKGTTIEIVHRLLELGYIGFKDGYQGSVEYAPRLSRIWAKSKLIKHFEDAAFGYFDVNYSKDREVIILRDEEKMDIEYKDTHHIKAMRKLVNDYNELLRKTFIDIQEYNIPRIELKEKKERRKRNKPVFVNITHHDKFIRRIFNNSTWDDGGRFYGGWWQRIDGSHRKGIRFNNNPTVEIDYSSLHVILAYAHENLDYWENTDKDPYDIPVRGVNNPEHIRDIAKSFFLLAFNASDETALYKAFRSELDYDKYPYSFPDKVLAELLENIKLTHPDVADMICTGAGLMLMNIDSKIAEYIIRDFVKTDTPILTVHDSFIVPIGEEDRLDNLMKDAFNEVTKKHKVKVKFNQNMTLKGINQFKFSTGMDREYYLDSMKFIAEGNPSKGYQHRWKSHKEYFRL